MKNTEVQSLEAGFERWDYALGAEFRERAVSGE